MRKPHVRSHPGSRAPGSQARLRPRPAAGVGPRSHSATWVSRAPAPQRVNTVQHSEPRTWGSPCSAARSREAPGGRRGRPRQGGRSDGPRAPRRNRAPHAKPGPALSPARASRRSSRPVSSRKASFRDVFTHRCEEATPAPCKQRTPAPLIRSVAGEGAARSSKGASPFPAWW